MVVHNFNVRGTFGRPAKANTELVINPDAVLTLAIPRQSLKSVAWWRAQELQRIRGVQLSQFAGCYLRHIREAPTLPGLEQSLGSGAPEAFYHPLMI